MDKLKRWIYLKDGSTEKMDLSRKWIYQKDRYIIMIDLLKDRLPVLIVWPMSNDNIFLIIIRSIIQFLKRIL